MPEFVTLENHAAGIRVIAGDNRAVLRALAAVGERFPLIVGSPPYNLGNSASAREHPHSSKGSAFPNGIAYDNYDDALPEDEYQAIQVETLNLAAAVLARDGSLFYVHKDRIVDGEAIDPAVWIRRSDLVIHQRIVWDQARTHAHNARYCSITNEWVFWLTHRHWYGVVDKDVANLGSVWRIVEPQPAKPKPGQPPPHPCPYPDALASRIILLASQPGDHVLDPWAGTGTTGQECQKAGRRYTGIDLSPRYCHESFERLSSYQPPLFVPAPMLPGLGDAANAR